jgi:hypothetical protein
LLCSYHNDCSKVAIFLSNSSEAGPSRTEPDSVSQIGLIAFKFQRQFELKKTITRRIQSSREVLIFFSSLFFFFGFGFSLSLSLSLSSRKGGAEAYIRKASLSFSLSLSLSRVVAGVVCVCAFLSLVSNILFLFYILLSRRSGGVCCREGLVGHSCSPETLV